MVFTSLPTFDHGSVRCLRAGLGKKDLLAKMDKSVLVAGRARISLPANIEIGPLIDPRGISAGFDLFEAGASKSLPAAALETARG